MKKSVMILLSVVLIFAFTGCGASNKTQTSDSGEAVEMGTNRIAELLNDGYELGMMSCSENEMKCILTKGENYELIIRITAKMSAELYDKYEAISFDDEQYEEKRQAFTTYLEIENEEDISDIIPTQDELNTYIGKTVGELEADGFENSGNLVDEEKDCMVLFYDGSEYCVEIGTELKADANLDDYSNNDLKKLKITSIEFTGIGNNLVD